MIFRDLAYLARRLTQGVTGRFTKQGVKYGDESLIYIFLDNKSQRLYRVEISETTIEKELPRLQTVKTGLLRKD